MKRWLSLICSLLLFIFLSTSSSQYTTYAEGTTYTVAGEIVHLRDGPGLSFSIVDTLKQGETLTYVEKNGDWIHVKVNGQEGWVAAWLVTASTEKKQSSTIAVSQVNRLNIRSEPSLSAVVVGQLDIGQQASILQQQAEWIQIDYDGLNGWVSSNYVTINDSQLKNTTNKQVTTTDDLKQGTHYFTIQVDALHIRKKPDLNAKIVKTVEKNQSFAIVERQGNWLQVEFDSQTTGWVYSFYGTITTSPNKQQNNTTSSTKQTQYVTIIYNGTNLREQPSTSAEAVMQVDAGESFKIVAKKGDWFQIATNQKKTAFVASWVVSVSDSLGNQIDEQTTKEKTPRKKGTLKGLTIVVDAGHGGNDHGTTGVRGTEEKELTLKTASLLASKLGAAGAEVIMTRDADYYLDLRKRVSIAHQHSADAFISIHYDATEDNSISGFTTYYMNSYQQPLAQQVHKALSKKMTLRDRGAQQGNYLVLRENRQPAILLELGYLSNPGEERAIVKSQFREQATLGIYNGVLHYFDGLLE